MKKLISILTTAVICAGISASVFADAAWSNTVVMGDSIATGYGLEGYTAGDNFGAADSFGSLISEGASSYANYAVDGRTSEELLEAYKNEEFSVADADNVIISIGGNDLLRPMLTAVTTQIMSDEELMSGLMEGTTQLTDILPQMTQAVVDAVSQVDTALTGENISELMQLIHEDAPQCDIYVLTVYDPFAAVEELPELSALAEEKLAQMNGAISSAAQENGAVIVDVYSAFKGREAELTNITTGDVHPSKAGHAEIYALLTAASTSGTVTISKPSPDTGAPTATAALGIAALAGAALILSRKRRAS